MTSIDWARRSWVPVRHPEYPSIVTAFRSPQWHKDAARRPPFGPPLLGKRSTAGGRGNRKSASLEARTNRQLLALEALRLRNTTAMTITQIAQEIGVGRTTVGKWLCGIPSMIRLVAAGDRLMEDVERPRDASEDQPSIIDKILNDPGPDPELYT